VPFRKASKKPHLEPAAETPAEGAQRNLERPTADEIYEQVSRNARHELDRPGIALAISGLAGGITMGLTALSVSIILASLPPSKVSSFIALLAYPIEFIAVIVGRAQLFTENTLYPVALMFAERRHFWTTLRLWSIVLPSNLVGAFLFAVLAVRTGALRPEYVRAMGSLGEQAVNVSGVHVFWSAVIGGWIIALVAWLVSGSHSITGSVMLIWLLAFLVGGGSLCALHRQQRRDSCGSLGAPGGRGVVFLVAAAGGPGQHRRRRGDRDAAGIRTGKGWGAGRPRVSALRVWRFLR